jgi:hypothetical protein
MSARHSAQAGIQLFWMRAFAGMTTRATGRNVKSGIGAWKISPALNVFRPRFNNNFYVHGTDCLSQKNHLIAS